MKVLRYRDMTLDEQESMGRVWGIKTPSQMMLDGEFIYDHAERARYNALWVVKYEYEDTPKIVNNECDCCRCCECTCDLPCTCDERNANGECVYCFVGERMEAKE